MSTTPLLETINLTVGYPGKVLFKDLSLLVHPGQLICFMGKNGAGKSTLIKTLASLRKPLSGSIVFNGTSMLPEQLIALVLTDPIRAAYLKVYDLVLLGRYPYLDWRLEISPEDQALVDNSLHLVGISSIRDRYINELSDGQRQMAMIARALAQDTPLLLLDEPTAHLDLNNRVEVMKLLKQLTRSSDKAILMSTHELDLALQTADQIWLAGNNNDIFVGIPEDLVLGGVFDDVFEFKGFDLKTGRVQHSVSKAMKISIQGKGHQYLWTKNFIERTGYSVVDRDAEASIEILTGNITRWQLNGEIVCHSLADLQVALEKI